MKEEIVNFVSSVVKQREYLIKNNKSRKNLVRCRGYLYSVKANLIGRRKLTEIAAKKIFLKFEKEILYLIPEGNNASFEKRRERFQKILEQCI